MKTTARLVLVAAALSASLAFAQQQSQQPKPPTAEQLVGQVQVLQMQLQRSQEGEQILGRRLGELITQITQLQDELDKLKPAAPKK